MHAFITTVLNVRNVYMRASIFEFVEIAVNSKITSVFRLSSADSATLCGNLEDINSFQQGLCLALEECTK